MTKKIDVFENNLHFYDLVQIPLLKKFAELRCDVNLLRKNVFKILWKMITTKQKYLTTPLQIPSYQDSYDSAPLYRG